MLLNTCENKNPVAYVCNLKLKKKQQFHHVVLRMGVLHMICNLMSTIGERFGDAGLRDLAVEPGAVADGSINGVLEGGKYNREVRLHKLVYDALLRIA